MNEYLKTCLIVCPLVFAGGFVDAVAGGGGIITIPAYLLAGLPAHLAAGTNKVVNGSGAVVASAKYIRGGKVQLRPVLLAVCNTRRREACARHDVHCARAFVPEDVLRPFVRRGPVLTQGDHGIVQPRIGRYHTAVPVFCR